MRSPEKLKLKDVFLKDGGKPSELQRFDFTQRLDPKSTENGCVG